MLHYDFILFENYHLATHHKYDVLLIAKLLRHAGLKVALLDIYHEDKGNDKDGVPIIHIATKRNIPNDQWQKHPKNKLHSLFCSIRFLCQQHIYMNYVIKEIEPLADSFYCGSYHLNMPLAFLKCKKACYWWGLRSSRMTNFWYHFKNNPVLGFRMLMLRHYFKKNRSQRLFVSNEIIKHEFEKLGISSDRMVIREERCITELGHSDYEKLSHCLSFLTIGMLRPDKRIGYTVNEFKQCKMPEWKYVLAGRSQGEYEKDIERSINGISNIERINEYMDYNKFNTLIKKAHFVVLADKKQKSSITNGTMLEALINYRPIIAPDYDPYKFYIDKYGIGITFNPEIPHDLTNAMQKASIRGCKDFYENIKNFLATIQFDFVSGHLYKQIYNEER